MLFKFNFPASSFSSPLPGTPTEQTFSLNPHTRLKRTELNLRNRMIKKLDLLTLQNKRQLYNNTPLAPRWTYELYYKAQSNAQTSFALQSEILGTIDNGSVLNFKPYRPL